MTKKLGTMKRKKTCNPHWLSNERLCEK